MDSPAEIGILWLMVGPVVGGTVGYLIGKDKGRGTEGILLGIFLGCLGWVIVAILKPSQQSGVGQPYVAPSQYVPSSGASPAGWHPDPFRRFQYRYWDGSTWTDQVSTDGRQYTDPPH